jgi:hypothetical protein
MFLELLGCFWDALTQKNERMEIKRRAARAAFEAEHYAEIEKTIRELPYWEERRKQIEEKFNSSSPEIHKIPDGFVNHTEYWASKFLTKD